MTGSGFTAPVSGWYEFEPGREPRLLAEMFDQPGVQTFHFEEGDTVMNSGGALSTDRPTLTVDWGHE